MNVVIVNIWKEEMSLSFDFINMQYAPVRIGPPLHKATLTFCFLGSATTWTKEEAEEIAISFNESPEKISMGILTSNVKDMGRRCTKNIWEDGVVIEI